MKDKNLWLPGLIPVNSDGRAGTVEQGIVLLRVAVEPESAMLLNVGSLFSAIHGFRRRQVPPSNPNTMTFLLNKNTLDGMAIQLVPRVLCSIGSGLLWFSSSCFYSVLMCELFTYYMRPS